MYEIIDLLQGALADPWMLLFLAVWGVGYFVKEHTPLPGEDVYKRQSWDTSYIVR